MQTQLELTLHRLEGVEPRAERPLELLLGDVRGQVGDPDRVLLTQLPLGRRVAQLEPHRLQGNLGFKDGRLR